MRSHASRIRISRCWHGVSRRRGVIIGAGMQETLSSCGSRRPRAGAPDTRSAHARIVLLQRSVTTATFFAVGSTLFLLLCAPDDSRPLAWLGVVASVLLVSAFPAAAACCADGQQFLWMPCCVRGPLGLWLLITGPPCARGRSSHCLNSGVAATDRQHSDVLSGDLAVCVVARDVVDGAEIDTTERAPGRSARRRTGRAVSSAACAPGLGGRPPRRATR